MGAAHAEPSTGMYMPGLLITDVEVDRYRRQPDRSSSATTHPLVIGRRRARARLPRRHASDKTRGRVSSLPGRLLHRRAHNDPHVSRLDSTRGYSTCARLGSPGEDRSRLARLPRPTSRDAHLPGVAHRADERRGPATQARVPQPSLLSAPAPPRRRSGRTASRSSGSTSNGPASKPPTSSSEHPTRRGSRVICAHSCGSSTRSKTPETTAQDGPTRASTSRLSTRRQAGRSWSCSTTGAGTTQAAASGHLTPSYCRSTTSNPSTARGAFANPGAGSRLRPRIARRLRPLTTFELSSPARGRASTL